MSSPAAKKILVKLSDGPFRDRAEKVLRELGFLLVPLLKPSREGPEFSADDFTMGLIELRAFQGTETSNPSLRFIVVSTNAIDSQTEAFRARGVVGHLSQTCSDDELISVIEHAEKCVADPIYEITDTLEVISGVQLRKEKRSLVESRLRRRMSVLGMKSIHEYGEHFVANRAEEIPKAISLVTTHTTEFFREEAHFDELFQTVFPRLSATNSVIRIWSAACSTGQEVYSLAIAYLEFRRVSGNRGPELEIWGTDIDPVSLRTAREGIFRKDQITGLSMEIRTRYFDEGRDDLNDYVRVKDLVHQCCHFERVNLKSDTFPTRDWDLIFLRNALIYFTPSDITDIVNKMARTLKPEGLLFLGHSESLAGLHTPYKKLGNSIYGFNQPTRLTEKKKIQTSGETTYRPQEGLVLIGASTGGVEALRTLLEDMPADSPPVLIVQHIPATFSETLARRLNETCLMTVAEARNGDKLEKSHAYIAPGGRQMYLRHREGTLFIEINDDPPVGLHRPSVNYLFDSVEPLARKIPVVAALLTGMGTDGAQGLLRLRQAGAHTIAQDEETSVVFGMPGAAIQLDGAIEVLPLPAIAHRLTQILGKKQAA